MDHAQAAAKYREFAQALRAKRGRKVVDWTELARECDVSPDARRPLPHLWLCDERRGRETKGL